MSTNGNEIKKIMKKLREQTEGDSREQWDSAMAEDYEPLQIARAKARKEELEKQVSDLRARRAKLIEKAKSELSKNSSGGEEPRDGE